jgi:MoaA/NifB/PqqE/SkfB family radical SAM enzyme
MLLADRKFAFEEHLSKQGLCLARKSPSILQINLGKLCNLACVHCHVNAGPGRKEIMDPATFDRVDCSLAFDRDSRPYGRRS